MPPEKQVPDTYVADEGTSGHQSSADREPTLDEKIDILAMMLDRIIQQNENILTVLAGDECSEH